MTLRACSFIYLPMCVDMQCNVLYYTKCMYDVGTLGYGCTCNLYDLRMGLLVEIESEN